MLESYTSGNDVEELLRNAELRTELEPYYDESISIVNAHHFSLSFENEFLACMLEWETAPILPIYRWFEPEMRLPQPDLLSGEDLHEILEDTIRRLYEKKIVLDFTDHLSDLELYRLIYQDILPSREKKLEYRSSFIHWDCSHAGGDPNIWLAFYASDEERECWAETYKQPLPPKEIPQFHRDLPADPI